MKQPIVINIKNMVGTIIVLDSKKVIPNELKKEITDLLLHLISKVEDQENQE